MIGLLVNQNSTQGQGQARDVQEAAQKLGLQLVVLNGGSDEDIDAAFANLARLKVGALLVGADPSFDPRRNRLIAMVAQHAVPAIYQFRDYALAGGLMSYGASIAELYQQVGIYVGRVLHGDKPGDMPVILPAKFEMVINLKTAKALGFDIPPQLLAQADEVIEKRREFIAALCGAAASATGGSGAGRAREADCHLIGACRKRSARARATCGLS